MRYVTSTPSADNSELEVTSSLDNTPLKKEALPQLLLSKTQSQQQASSMFASATAKKTSPAYEETKGTSPSRIHANYSNATKQAYQKEVQTSKNTPALVSDNKTTAESQSNGSVF